MIARLLERFRNLNLAAATSLALLGLVVFAAIAWFLIGFITIGGYTWEITSSGINRAGATQIVLTMVAGAGAAVALVVAYRRQKRTEDGHFLERLGAAAAQLGADRPAVQFAGVYGLAALADESDHEKRQQVIDVLCGYIRLPYDPETSGRADMQTRVEKFTGPPIGGVSREVSITKAYRPAEREVRATIFQVIRQHLRLGVSASWQKCHFDFTGASIDACDLESGDGPYSMSFRGAEFTGDVNILFGSFTNLDLSLARFAGGSVRIGASSSEGSSINFNGAQFLDGDVDLGYVFERGSFSFDKTQFRGGTVRFRGGQFSGASVDLRRAEFLGGMVDFDEPMDWRVPPLMPWQDGDATPTGVLPRSWPPVAVNPWADD